MAPKKRKYDESYIQYGFTEIEVKGESRPQCVLCATVLSNEALKPNKLERHLKTSHPQFAAKPKEFFQSKQQDLKKMKLGPSGTRYESAENTLTASFEVSYLISKAKKPHTIGETLIKPCLLKVAEHVLNNEAKQKIQDIALSNNTVKSRIQKMSDDVEEQLLDKLKLSPYFGLQCDESTDISQCCQLLVFVRFLDIADDTIKEDFLFLHDLETTSKAKDVVKEVDDYFESKEISWKKLAGACTDGAPSMIGCRSGAAALIKQKNPHTVTSHCIIHRQALAAKTLPAALKPAMELAIKLVNTVKKSPLNARIFKHLCNEMESEHEILLFYTEVRWLSRGNMLERLFELKEELKEFLREKKMNDLLVDLIDPVFELQLAYLVDIFAHLNQLNLQLQGSGNRKLCEAGNIFGFEDKLRAFICKIDLWIKKVEMENYTNFPTFEKIMRSTDENIVSSIQHQIIEHLQALKGEFSHYFPEFNQEEPEILRRMIRNPFIVNVLELPDEIQEELIELQNDRSCKESFDSGINLEEFWCKKAKSYPKIREKAIQYLVMFSTTYLCEQGFSSMLLIKNKQRSRLDCEDDMRLALSTIEPRIPQLVKSMRAQKSSSQSTSQSTK